MTKKSHGETINCQCNARTGNFECACTERVYFPPGKTIPNKVICDDCSQGKHDTWD